MNILIVKLSAIGDVIHTLPALNALRAWYPKAHITWLVETAAADLVLGHGALDRVIVSHRKRWLQELKGPSRKQAFAEIRGFWRALRDTRYDMIIDFQGLLKSALPVRLARGKRRIGFDKGMQHQEHSYLFYNERIAPVDMEVHALTRGLMLLNAIGVETPSVVYDVPVSANDRQTVKALLEASGIDGSRPLVAINPVALWDTKLWLNERFSLVADRLASECGVDLVFTGGPGDRKTMAQIRERMKQASADFSGQTTLTQLAALYQKADLLVTTDTGPMHLAAAVDTPVVAIFGSTAPWRTGPFGQGHTVVRTAPPCSPCFKRRCEVHQHRCMQDISVEMVFEAAAAHLDARPI